MRPPGCCHVILIDSIFNYTSPLRWFWGKGWLKAQRSRSSLWHLPNVIAWERKYTFLCNRANINIVVWLVWPYHDAWLKEFYKSIFLWRLSREPCTNSHQLASKKSEAVTLIAVICIQLTIIPYIFRHCDLLDLNKIHKKKQVRNNSFYRSLYWMLISCD